MAYQYALRRRLMRILVLSRLPKEYQEVEYLQSSATTSPDAGQRINTGIYPNAATKVVADAEFLSGANYAMLCGAYTSGSNQFAIFYNNKWNAWFGSAVKTLSGGYTGRKTFTLGGGVFSVDSSSIAVSSSAFTLTFPLTIFAMAQTNATTFYYHSSIKLYSMQIYEGSTLVRDFVPCYRKSDNAGGLYDLVNGVFYANVGTGSFTVGSAVNTPGAGSGTTPSTQATVQLTGTFTSNYSDVAVVIGGVTYNTSQTLTIPFGTTITLRVSINGAYTSDNLVKITIDGVTVASQSKDSETLTYNYTVNSSCAIESYVLYTVGPASVLSLKVTTQ